MKKTILLLFFFSFLIVQAQENKSEKKIMKPRYMGENNQNKISPNEIWLEGVILNRRKAKNCNSISVCYVDVDVKKVIGSGSGIVNQIIANHKYSFSMNKNLNKKIKKLSNNRFKITLTEELCMSKKETSYKVLKLTSIN